MEDEVQALECTLELNKQFAKPLREYEVVKTYKECRNGLQWQEILE